MLKNKIHKSREIKDASLNTYLSALKKIKNKVDGTTTLDNTDFLQDYDKIMNIITQENKLTSKKNKLTAVLVALNSDDPKNNQLLKKYGDKLKEYGEQYLSLMKSQTKDKKQSKNWLEYSELIDVANKLTKEVKHQNIGKTDTLKKKELDILQQLLIVRTYLTFPLRNDFADMKVISLKELKKISKEDIDKNNYLVILSNNKKEFHINQYKNNKKWGNKIYDIPSPLNRIINVWLKYNKTGYFLIKQNLEPMNPNSITKFLNKIFKKYSDKKISTSMIRHIIISHNLEGEETLKEKDDKEKKMEDKFLNSSATQHLIYRKVK